ncbi:MAG: hypothetical protein RR382_07985 [Tannerellaceae bacterium]
MKSRFLFTISFICSLSLLQGKATNGHWITFQSLLQEMTNRDVLAQYPTISYKALQASSYNRESVSPSQPGWFADSDGVSCLRTETINGQKEWVMMEDFGPGCIAKIWAVCFYYSMNDTIGGNISIYLDGAKEPVIRTNLFYTGLTDKAMIREQEGPARSYPLDRSYQAEVNLSIPALGYTWLVIE